MCDLVVFVEEEGKRIREEEKDPGEKEGSRREEGSGKGRRIRVMVQQAPSQPSVSNKGPS